MDGGAPAGMRSLAGPEGCRTSRTRMRMMTRHGKSRTTPSGMEILELPRSRIRRRKKANRGVRYSRCWERLLTAGSFSREVKLRGEGSRFASFCTNPIVQRRGTRQRAASHDSFRHAPSNVKCSAHAEDFWGWSCGRDGGALVSGRHDPEAE